MKFDITRNVISDLWPLYQSGEASKETQQIVEDFLQQDADFHRALMKSEQIEKGVPIMRLSPDAEMEMIKVARGRTRAAVWLIGGAIAAGALVILIPIIIAAALYG